MIRLGNPRPRVVVLAVLCLATLTISLATTAVNVALPSLAVELDASNRQLQWIVDAYNILFATFVLAFGSLSDRYGRKGALIAGLAIFGGGALGASTASTALQLVGWQGLMGLGAAFVYPTTLSILSNVFTDRASKAKAIGIWGATTGVGVACGPILGGWLLESFAWGERLPGPRRLRGHLDRRREQSGHYLAGSGNPEHRLRRAGTVGTCRRNAGVHRDRSARTWVAQRRYDRRVLLGLRVLRCFGVLGTRPS